MKNEAAVDETQEVVTTEEQESAPSEQEEQPTTTRVIETPMSDDERIAVGTELAELLAIIATLEQEKKDSNRRYNDNIGVKQGNAHKLGEKFLKAVHTAERECPIDYHWDTGEKKVLHPDTGAVIFEDSISNAERQKFMPGFEDQVDDGDYNEEPEGDLMKCANIECEDELDGLCTKPTGDISCSGYKAVEAEDDDGGTAPAEGEEPF